MSVIKRAGDGTDREKGLVMSLPRVAEEMFIDRMGSDEQYHGLWVYGGRQTGKTALVRKFYDEHPDLLAHLVGIRRTAGKVEEQYRTLWKMWDTYKMGKDDIPFLKEIYAAEEAIDYIFDSELIWIDDLWPEYDEMFVRKNILIRLDSALKAHKVVFVSGLSAPEHYGNDWATAIRAMYVVVNLGDGKR